MAESESDGRISTFIKTGVYPFDEANAVFLDPVRMLNRSYTRFRVSSSAYYSRFFSNSLHSALYQEADDVSKKSARKRKRGKDKLRLLNPSEQIAEQRHQEMRPLLSKAHEALLGTSCLLETLPGLRNDAETCNIGLNTKESELDLVMLGSGWQAHSYEIILKVHREEEGQADIAGNKSYDDFAIPVYENFVANEETSEIEAKLFDHKYILPRESCFYMSDLRQIHNMIPAESDCGFNLIVIDPPWENGSAHQKQKYKTLPSRYFLSLPVKQLAHTDGALVALWMTNREKLRNFVDEELFPKWGVKHAATFYWLKVKANGSLVSDLDLLHHKPYECLLLGFTGTKEMNSEHPTTLRSIPDRKVFISIPGDYSRKPPIGELLRQYVPGNKPARCLDLFSREILPGWTCWGNEPLKFQSSSYFFSQ